MWALAEFGVHVFFVISGFLITGLLLHEMDRTNRISLPRFYFRRTLRIFPAYYALVLALLIAQSMGLVQLAPKDAAHTLSYTSNYYLGRSWLVGHTWSLSVEEQFYLLWPAVLLIAGSRRAAPIAAAVVLACPFIRVGEWELLRTLSGGIGHRFETVADAIAAGCLLAALRPRLHQSPLYLRALHSRWFLLVPLAAILGNMTHDHPLIAFGLGFTLTNVAVALCIDRCVTVTDGPVGLLLNTRPFVFVGALSYSLYLWQQPFLNRASNAWLAAFPSNILLVVGAALLSYYAVEQPALRIRRSVEGRRRAASLPAPVPVPLS